MLIFGPLKSNDWQKNNVALNNSKQLVSHGEAVGRAGRHTALLCNFMDAHQSTVSGSQRAPQSKCFPLGFSQNNRLKEQRKANELPANGHGELQEGGRCSHMEVLHRARMNLWASSLSLSLSLSSCVCVCVSDSELPSHPGRPAGSKVNLLQCLSAYSWPVYLPPSLHPPTPTPVSSFSIT